MELEPLGGPVMVSIGLIEGTGGIRQATTVTAQTIDAKAKAKALRSMPALGEYALAA